MSAWWQRDIIEPQKLPLMLCFIAFVITFAVTRLITRMIRAGKGPFKDHITSSGTHLHHAVSGLAMLTVGAFTAVGAYTMPWRCIGGILVGIGLSLVLDEFALILYLEDVYWSTEGRLSVNVVCVTAAIVGLALVGLTPLGVNDVGGSEMSARIGASLGVLSHGALVSICLLKGKYRVAMIGLFIPLVAIVTAFRLARPGSYWARRRRYSGRKLQRATHRAEKADQRWQPLLTRWNNAVGGTPTDPRTS